MKTKWMMALFVVTTALAIGSLGCRHAPDQPATAGSQKVAYYTCPMHPSVKSDSPGTCHICGMDLVAVYTNTPAVKP